MLPPPDVLYSHNRHRLGILRPYNTYFVTVSAPVDQFKALGLRPLIAASETTGNMLTKEDIVIYESTVYPGCADPDLHNVGMVDICHELVQFGLDVDIYNPRAEPEEIDQQLGLQILRELSRSTTYDTIVVAVAHWEFLNFDYGDNKKWERRAF